MTTPHHTPTMACSFCGKGPDDVERLIAGPDVCICDGCVRLAHGILQDLDGEPADRGAPRPAEFREPGR